MKAKPNLPPAYAEQPFGVECALPGVDAHLARSANARVGFWARLRYRVKFGIKLGSGRRVNAV